MAFQNSPLFQRVRREQQPRPRELSEEEQEEINYAFTLLDKDSQHFVTHKELKIALRGLGFPVRKADVAALMRDHGLGQDASLTLPLFRALVAAKVAERTQQDDIHRAFQLFDLEGSGAISAKNLGVIAKQLKLSLEQAEVEDMVREFDKDGDGMINESEFQAIMAAACVDD